MGKSFNPILVFETLSGAAQSSIVLMSLQPAIPRRVALLHCPPPLHRLVSIFYPPAETVNHHLPRGWGFFNRHNGEFSTGVDTLVKTSSTDLD